MGHPAGDSTLPSAHVGEGLQAFQGGVASSRFAVCAAVSGERRHLKVQYRQIERLLIPRLGAKLVQAYLFGRRNRTEANSSSSAETLGKDPST